MAAAARDNRDYCVLTAADESSLKSTADTVCLLAHMPVPIPRRRFDPQSRHLLVRLWRSVLEGLVAVIPLPDLNQPLNSGPFGDRRRSRGLQQVSANDGT